ncbi:Nose resistant to fluoxetine protein 6, partial [Stegodyphus mimosarum]
MGLLLEYTIMLLIVIFWILLGSLRPAASAVVPETTTVGNVSTIPPLKTVPEIEKEIEALVGSISKMALPYFVRNSDLKLSPSCMSTFFKIFVDIRKLKMPIVKLLDAMAKPPFGIMEGTFIVMGDYDECLEVSSSKKGDVPMTKDEEYYHGQYCTVEVSLPPKLDEALLDYGRGKLNLSFFGKLAPFVKEFPVTFRNLAKFRIGVCLPSTCTEEDLTEILGLNPLSFIPVRVDRCEDGLKKPLNADQMVFFVVIALFAVLILSGTALDAWFHIKYSTYKGDHKDKFIKLLLAFSVYSNTKKLMTPSKKSGGEIPVVNGMYVMGTVLVIIYHTYFLPFLTTFSSHVTNVGTYLDDFFFTLIAVMGISIEAYFLF